MFHPIFRSDERNLRRAPGRSGNSITCACACAWAQRNVVTIEKKLISQLIVAAGGWIRTESEKAFIRHVRCTTDEITRVTFSHLIVAYVVTFHISALKLVKNARDLLCAGRGLQLEREEDVRTVGEIVPVYELRHLARVYNRVKSKKAEEG